MNCPGVFKVFYRQPYVKGEHGKAIGCFIDTNFFRTILWKEFRGYKLVFLDTGKIYPGLFERRVHKSISRIHWEF